MFWILIFLVVLSGCKQDYTLGDGGSCETPDPEIVEVPVEVIVEVPVEVPVEVIVEVPAEVPPPGPPDIDVSPLEDEFGWLDVLNNETYQSIYSIVNVGESDLEIQNIYLANAISEYSLNYSLQAIPASQVMEFSVTFEPLSSGLKIESIFIESNDPDEPLVEVVLHGTGLAPQIEVEPIFHNFGQPFLGCTVESETIIRNVGTTGLEVSNITYSSTSDLYFEFDDALYGSAPWFLYPGEEIISIIGYEAYDETYDIGYLTINSNDPLNPVTITSQEGDATIGGVITDEFIQEETEEVDILFVIDNSCSMSNEQTKLATNAASFIARLNTSGADYRLATITTDSPRFRGPVLHPGYPDIATEFANQLVAGILGSPFEEGLEMAYQAVSPNGDAEPGGLFQRTGAVLSIIFVSDEDDYSSFPVFPHYINYFQSLKSAPNKLILHAVADDPFDNRYCGGNAFRYEEAVSLTGGVFASICKNDWSADLRDLANGSLIPNLDFPLSEIPVEGTIEVFVNGILITVGWSYEPTDNSVIFSEPQAPEGGDLVEIIYGHYTECS